MHALGDGVIPFSIFQRFATSSTLSVVSRAQFLLFFVTKDVPL